MFKSLYDSPLVATLLPCLVSLVVLGVALRKAGFVRVFGVLFAIEIAADAYLNGPWTFVKPNTALSTACGVTFVILGDFRYFVVFEKSLHNAHIWLRALAWAFVVPVAAQIVRWIIPRIEHDERSTFLLYELLFFALAAGFRTWRVPRAKDVRLARRATTFEIVQYGAWILADVGLSLWERDAFYLLRLVANLLYYVAFVPVMMMLLAAKADESGR